MKKTFFFILCLYLLVLPAHAGNGRIFGVVADESGQPVGEARVEVSREISHYNLVTFTTSGGEYSFNDVPLGIYLVSVTHKGVFLGDQTVEFMLPGNREVRFIVDRAIVE